MMFRWENNHEIICIINRWGSREIEREREGRKEGSEYYILFMDLILIHVFQSN